MPQNSPMTRKFKTALETIEKNEEYRKALPRYKRMSSQTLYIAMAGIGLRWDVENRVWYRKVQANLAPERNGTNIKARTSARRDKVLMRIVTHKAVKDAVLSEITELIEALNYTVNSVSGGYQNADGDYVRVYINMTRNTAISDNNVD
jgi:hypothetical protein